MTIMKEHIQLKKSMSDLRKDSMAMFLSEVTIATPCRIKLGVVLLTISIHVAGLKLLLAGFIFTESVEIKIN